MRIANANAEHGAPLGTNPVNFLSGASTQVTARASAESPTHQNGVDPALTLVEHAEFTVREYTNYLCTKCNMAVSGYLVQVAP